MIPAEIDVQQIIDDLNRLGWRDQKIEIACGLSAGYVSKLRGGPRPERPYQLLARLYNFWEDECSRIASTIQPARHYLPTGKLWTTARSD